MIMILMMVILVISMIVGYICINLFKYKWGFARVWKWIYWGIHKQHYFMIKHFNFNCSYCSQCCDILTQMLEDNHFKFNKKAVVLMAHL